MCIICGNELKDTPITMYLDNAPFNIRVDACGKCCSENCQVIGGTTHVKNPKLKEHIENVLGFPTSQPPRQTIKKQTIKKERKSRRNIVIEHECPVCNTTFFAKRQQVYCSDNCRTTYKQPTVMRRHPLKPWQDPESLFCDTKFLEEYLGKAPTKGTECKD